MQARAQVTRGRIVEAAGACLVERGFAGASTASVAQAAGVSQGALFRHFPQKPQLLAACVESLLAGFVEAFRDEVKALPEWPLPERIDPAVAALWAVFRRPEMHAVFEVYVAARTDNALAAALEPILERHRENILVEARRLFPEIPLGSAQEAAVDAVVYVMQGVRLGLLSSAVPREAEHLALFARLARHEIAHALRGDGGGEEG